VGFGLGSVLAPQHTDKLDATSVSARVRPVVNAPGPAQRPPALARVKHAKKRAKTRATGTATTPTTGQQSAAVSGTSSAQPQTQSSSGGATAVTKTKTQPQQATQPQSDTGTTSEPPPFDEHTTSTP
jgi:hypothetical protein